MPNGIVCREQARQLSRQVEGEDTDQCVGSHPRDTRSYGEALPSRIRTGPRRGPPEDKSVERGHYLEVASSLEGKKPGSEQPAYRRHATKGPSETVAQAAGIQKGSPRNTKETEREDLTVEPNTLTTAPGTQ